SKVLLLEALEKPLFEAIKLKKKKKAKRSIEDDDDHFGSILIFETDFFDEDPFEFTSEILDESFDSLDNFDSFSSDSTDVGDSDSGCSGCSGCGGCD
ncbi:MAG: hypothetical protein AB8F95_20490, partial [Bacteroidia bacterium]